MLYSPSNPSPVPIKCELCDGQTTTGICASCASRLNEEGKLAEWERTRMAQVKDSETRPS
jgi:hypothetical protein